MPLTNLSFVIRGLPAPKGSTRGRPGGGVIPNASPKNAADQADWGSCARHAAIAALAAAGHAGQIAFVGVPVGLRVTWRMKRPVAHFVAKGPLAGTVKPTAPLLCTVAPDNSKLLRALEDWFNGLVWGDDKQVAVSSQKKIYAVPGAEGAVVHIAQLDPVTGQPVDPPPPPLPLFSLGGQP